MKSTKDPLDEALQKALKRKFDNFEKEPNPPLKERVFYSLKIQQGPGILQQFIILSLLFGIIITATLLVLSNLKQDLNGSLVQNVKHENIHTKLKSTRKSHVTSHQESLLQNNDYSIKIKLGETVEASAIKSLPDKQMRLEHVKDSAIFQKDQKFRRLDKRWNTEVFAGQVESNSANGIRSFSQQKEQENIAGFNHENSLALKINPAFDAQLGKRFQSQDLTYLKNKQAIFSEHNPLVPNWPTALLQETEKSGSILKRNKWAFLVSGSSMNTFQMLTINPDPRGIYQNFDFPEKISLQNIGYKYNIGIERNGLQFLLNYGRFSQSLRYEIATDEFLVEDLNAKDYKVIRKGKAVHDLTTFRFLGLGFKKHSVLKSGPFKKYYADLGMEVSRELQLGQNTMWGNVGIGKEIYFNKYVGLNIGPYLEYSFTRLRNQENSIKTQPYQLGVSVTLQYWKKQ